MYIKLKQIFLTDVWDKSFMNDSKIFIKNNEKIEEAIVLNKYSCFGENIDEIELLVNGIKERYSISNKSITYYK